MAFTQPATDLLPQHSLVIGDQWFAGGSGEKMPHRYPGTGTVTREIAMANGDIALYANFCAHTS